MKKFIYLSALCLTLILQACSQEAKVEEADLVMICTTDAHGLILPQNAVKTPATSNCLAALSTYIKQLREENPDGMMLFDTGDFFQGTPLLYYYNYVNPREPNIGARAANLLGYDAMQIGNHDLEPGEIFYREHLPLLLKAPMLCANASIKTADNNFFKPYTILERKGFRIAVIGLIAPEALLGLTKSSYPNIEFEKMSTAAQRCIETIKQKENPDMIIGLLHSGMEQGFKTKDSETIQELIDNAPGFDMLLLGHDHRHLQKKMIDCNMKLVYVLQPLPDMLEASRADIHLKRKDGKVEIEIIPSVVEINKMEIDQEFCDAFKPDLERVNKFMEHALGYTKVSMDGSLSLIRQNALADMLHATHIENTGAEISFVSALSSYNQIPAGAISMFQLWEMYRYENQLFKMWMTGEDILNFLEWGYGQQFDTMHSAKDHLLAFNYEEDGEIKISRFGPDVKTPHYNYTSAAGINYEVDVRKPAGKRVTITSMADGTPFDLERTYTVAISSYQATGGGGFIKNGLGWNDDDIKFHTLSQSPKDIRYYLAQYIKKHSPVTPKNLGRWRVVPEEWAAIAGERDLELMIPYIKKN